MALNFSQFAAPAPVAANGAAGQQERPKAKHWLNVGVVGTTTDEQGNEVQTFVGLPQGIALDTMEAMPVKGSNQAWKDLVESKNFILKQMQEAAATLKPGESKIFTMHVEVRAVNEEAAPSAPGENKLMASLKLPGVAA